MKQRCTVRACDRCHKHKKTCEGGVPCDGCRSTNSGCTFIREHVKVGRPRLAEPVVRKRTHSHNACRECKRKKKKCDERWPSCSKCCKANIACSGPFKRDVKKDNEKTDCDNQEPPSVVEPRKKIHENDIYDALDFLADISPSFSGFFSQPEISTIDLSSDLFSNNVSAELSNTEKMFLNSLIHSPKFSLDLGASPTSVSNSSELSEDDSRYSEERKSLLSLCHLNRDILPAADTELVVYFIQNVSPLLFVDKTSTRFLRTVIPLALEDPNVRYSILGMAASHRANNESDANETFRRDACIYRAKAQSLFLGTNVDYFQDSENVLMSILLVSVQEIFEGTSLYWSVALEKAAKIIDKRGGIKQMSRIAPLSVQLFCYLDLITSLSTCSSPYVDKREIPDYDESHIESILNNKFGFKFGIEGEIFKIIGNISTLASLRETRYASAKHEQRFNTLANLIEMKLQKWSPTLDNMADKYAIDETADTGRLVLQSFAIALQWSAFLRLHQIRHGYDRKDPRVEACLVIILRSMKVIEKDSDLETGLMFPLIMAGSVVYKPEDRKYILDRIRGIRKRLKFNYIKEFEKLLQAVWERDKYENHKVNWAAIRYFLYAGLVMF